MSTPDGTASDMHRSPAAKHSPEHASATPVLISEAGNILSDTHLIHKLISFGQEQAGLAADRNLTLTVMILPARNTAACWIALGSLLAGIRLSAQRNVWEALANTAAGTRQSLLVRKPSARSGWVVLTVELISFGRDADFAGDQAVSVRVVDGPRQYSGSTLKWNWRTWKREVYPPPAHAHAVRNRSQQNIDAVVTALAETARGTYVFSDQRSVTVVTDIASAERDTAGICIGANDRAPVELWSVLNGPNESVIFHSGRSGHQAPESPVLVLDGPRALRHLRPIDQGSIVVLLAYSEIDASVENILAPWLAEHDAHLSLGGLSSVEIPESWQVTVSRMAPLPPRS